MDSAEIDLVCSAFIQTFADVIEPIARDALTLSQDSSGIWVEFTGRRLYLGPCLEAAIFTARTGDGFLPGRDGKLLQQDIDWFSQRAFLGDSWQQHELPIHKDERKRRIRENLCDFSSSTDLGTVAPVQSSGPMSHEEMLAQREKERKHIQVEYRLIRLVGDEGLWAKPRHENRLYRAALVAKDDQLSLRLGASRKRRRVDSEKLIGEISFNALYEFVELKLYLDGSTNFLTIRNDGENVTLKKLRLE